MIPAAELNHLPQPLYVSIADSVDFYFRARQFGHRRRRQKAIFDQLGGRPTPWRSSERERFLGAAAVAEARSTAP